MRILVVVVAVLLVLFLVQSRQPDPLEGTLERFVKTVATRRVALVMPLHSDQTALLTKRFRSWSGRRSPCASRREHHRTDLVFYLGPHAKSNVAVIEREFMPSEARRCFRNVVFVHGLPVPVGSSEAEETFSFYRLFETVEIKAKYDVFFYMSPFVYQVRQHWADKIYEEAVLSDPFWVKGSAAMQTCPMNALTPEGDCDGAVNLGFPAVIHINVNALYWLGDSEFDMLRAHAEKKNPGVEPDVAMFKELVSTDHPLTSKLHRGTGHRKVIASGRQHDDNLSGARHKSDPKHVTSLYWAAHIHKYRYTDFIVNALAGKRHFKEDLRKGLHLNTFLVHQGINE